MRAAVISADRVTVETVPDPTPGPREVVVAVAACGICGTDLHIADGEFAPTLPVTPGHEFAGEVVGIGTDVTELRVGDQVAVDPSLHCGECYFCRRGRGNLCERWAAIGVSTTGGAAEYAVAPVANCVVLPPGVAPADAALIEPLSCAVRGFDVLAPHLGDHYLIYGAGTMGLMMMELAKRAGAASVSMVDLNPARLETAKELGCTHTVTSADELEQQRGWDNVIDCTGVVAAIEDGLGRVIRGGTFQQFGVANEDAVARFSPFRVYNQEIRIIGSMAVLHSFERAAELFADGVLRPEIMISDRKPLEEYPAALEQFRAGVGRKIQVRP
ncbi:zinc-dependent alcohol dehydrogenase family protein [Pseudonocardia sp. KRD-184]|uniref:Zinc-dependent alcohol dehydrogenase family protein n=1 Tax=Pseudonocardia oceani TaxID=2792013 RepID=A0ABS6UAS1_9PSEU|nr:zinc-dependent alcohol dehydrogenase family protein [Pseudonocardia oceani]MBW0093108.1 zinc-dependent alcohol dehydrogenase family protein [Pseudonocardia oceani]MBW0099901.1 zinc-dependent alcohol dehydrogenase family protein [Pseudonocardia oceani]MBW0112521.1 zinc-dependent alcohol dehydrogenase family protein [Pseudonocardia oceani]MBW0123786.1 zinc-dependent alcohol dehydrogenase family protein [Pseudonocardia oceani]MBW0129336.1 zinc-dependent alcohol dehydrogenase family protein [Ps